MKEYLTYEEKIQELKKRSTMITRMLQDLKEGKNIDFNRLTGLIALGHSSEISLLQEIEELKIQNGNNKSIEEIDVPSFMKKK